MGEPDVHWPKYFAFQMKSRLQRGNSHPKNSDFPDANRRVHLPSPASRAIKVDKPARKSTDEAAGVRPEQVQRAKKLIEDPNYPSLEVLRKLAAKLVSHLQSWRLLFFLH